MPAWFWLVAIPLFAVSWWMFLMWLIAHAVGWSALARHYRNVEPFEGKKHHFCSGKISFGNYGNCLIVGANSDGLYLHVFLLFRVGHPPLFIPWTDLTPRVKRLWFFEWLEFEPSRVPKVKVRFPAALARELATDANRAWEPKSVYVLDRQESNDNEG